MISHSSIRPGYFHQHKKLVLSAHGPDIVPLSFSPETYEALGAQSKQFSGIHQEAGRRVHVFPKDSMFQSFATVVPRSG